jgi:transmembrane sensor
MRPEPQRIDAEAALWAVRLSSGALKSEERSALDVWLDADPRHRGALVRAQSAWLDLDRLAALGAERQGAERAKEPPAPAAAPARRWFLAAGLSSLALTATAGLWAWRARGTVYASGVGEVRRVTLPDGTSMLLNTDSRAAVHFSDRVREVTLLDGEGLFEVVKDPARAFIVRAGAVSVRAVGTAFTVRALGPRVDVTVAEGVVEVADLNAPVATQTLVANEETSVTGGEAFKVRRISPAEAERHLAWREGMLSFDGERLIDAVEEINRHNRLKISIDDPALAARPVVGIFRSSDREGFAQTVAAALGAESVTDGDVIHLRLQRSP